MNNVQRARKELNRINKSRAEEGQSATWIVCQVGIDGSLKIDNGELTTDFSRYDFGIARDGSFISIDELHE